MIKMDSKGEILVGFPAQAAIADTTCPLFNMACLKAKTATLNHRRISLNWRWQMIWAILFCKAWDFSSNSLFLSHSPVPSHFRTFTPSILRRHSILSRNLAEQTYVEDCLDCRHDYCHFQVISTYFTCSSSIVAYSVSSGITTLMTMKTVSGSHLVKSHGKINCQILNLYEVWSYRNLGYFLCSPLQVHQAFLRYT